MTIYHDQFCRYDGARPASRNCTMPDSLSKSEFKTKALEVFRQVEASGEAVIITDHGKPSIEIRKFHPIARDPLQTLKGSVTRYTDPLEPVASEDWAALK
jgi:antitoxin (DNA-binding transcriptional repressor) of toxin-antitoxin stability system